jgi:hypothetical protein
MEYGVQASPSSVIPNLKYMSPLEWLCHSSRGLPVYALTLMSSLRGVSPRSRDPLSQGTMPTLMSSLRGCKPRSRDPLSQGTLPTLMSSLRGCKPRSRDPLSQGTMPTLMSSLRGCKPRSRDLLSQGTIRQHKGDALTNSLSAVRGMTCNYFKVSVINIC